MLRGKKLRWTLVAIVIPLVMAGTWIGLRSQRTPPLSTLERAYRSIDQAKAAGAARYARSLLLEAEQLLDLGEQAIRQENDSWRPLGSYHLADSLLDLAAQKAGRAAKAAHNKRATRRSQIQTTLAVLEGELGSWRQKLDSTLAPMECRRLWNEAGTNLRLARELVDRKEHNEADPMLQKARELIDDLADRFNVYRRQSDDRVDHWRTWVKETKDHTRETGKPAIIVDKSAHRLYVISKGAVQKSYPCELGFNSAVQKRVAGDGATPEGKYRVTEVKHQSKYYKALLLDYPNDADRERFRQNKREGHISSDARIGGLIEVHGGGGLEKDWTDGCVAVTDKQMDELMKLAYRGMWVTIVRQSGLKP